MRQASVPSTGLSTVTVTIEGQGNMRVGASETLVLRLNRKKKVTWKEGTVDNEFMQKKSSKKCCIYHKDNSFDEDDSDDDHDHSPHHDQHGNADSGASCSSNDRQLCSWFSITQLD